MTGSEFDVHCGNTTTSNVTVQQNRWGDTTTTPPVSSGVTFTADFGWRGFTANCFYFDELSGDWASDGVELLEDTNHEYTHW